MKQIRYRNLRHRGLAPALERLHQLGLAVLHLQLLLPHVVQQHGPVHAFGTNEIEWLLEQRCRTSRVGRPDRLQPASELADVHLEPSASGDHPNSIRGDLITKVLDVHCRRKHVAGLPGVRAADDALAHSGLAYELVLRLVEEEDVAASPAA